jgi:hypothetical protein
MGIHQALGVEGFKACKQEVSATLTAYSLAQVTGFKVVNQGGLSGT